MSSPLPRDQGERCRGNAHPGRFFFLGGEANGWGDASTPPCPCMSATLCHAHDTPGEGKKGRGVRKSTREPASTGRRVKGGGGGGKLKKKKEEERKDQHQRQLLCSADEQIYPHFIFFAAEVGGWGINSLSPGGGVTPPGQRRHFPGRGGIVTADDRRKAEPGSQEQPSAANRGHL